MRSSGNFHPEWGYLAPAPSFLRTVRTVFVAAAVGGIASAAVVLSLVGRPAAEDGNQSTAARTLVRQADAGLKTTSTAAQPPAEPQIQARGQALALLPQPAAPSSPLASESAHAPEATSPRAAIAPEPAQTVARNKNEANAPAAAIPAQVDEVKVVNPAEERVHVARKAPKRRRYDMMPRPQYSAGYQSGYAYGYAGDQPAFVRSW